MKPKIPGVPAKFELSNREYHYGVLKRALSSTGLGKLRRSALHYLTFINEEEKPPTPALIFGIAYHVFVLENHKFYDKIAIIPEGINKRTNAGKAEYAAFLEKNQGKTIISQTDMDKLKAMGKAMAQYKTVRDLLSIPGHFEQTVLWSEPEYGFMCKTRPDLELPPMNLIVELKSCEDAGPWGFAKSIANYNYDMAAAWQISGMRAATDKDYRLIWLAQEKDPPHAVGIYEADQEILDNGRAKLRPLVDLFAQCWENDDWPGYPDRVEKIYLPRWAMASNNTIYD